MRLYIPNWNGHLYLNEEDDSSISYLYEQDTSQDKLLVEVHKNDIKTILEKIEEVGKEQFGESIVGSIIGDHSSSYALIKAFASQNENFKLVIFDAHPDVEEQSGIVSHEDYLRALIEDGIVKPEQILLIGIRMYSRLEYNYLIEKGVHFIPMVDVLRDKKQVDTALVELQTPVYLSIDIDALDPDDAPGTYYAEYCGLYMKELQECIQLFKDKIKAFDIAEFYKPKDKDQITEKNVQQLMNMLLN